MPTADKNLYLLFALIITSKLTNRVSFIRLQLILPPKGLLVIVPLANVHATILMPLLAIAIPSALLINLS